MAKINVLGTRSGVSGTDSAVQSSESTPGANKGAITMGTNVDAMGGTTTATGGQKPPSRAKTLGKRSFARQTPEVALGRMHDEYLRSRRVENVRESTLEMYDGALRPWAAWCAAQGVTLVGQILTKHAEEYLLSLMARGLSERTVRNRAVVIKSALKFAHKRGYIASERMYDWKIPKMERASVYMPEIAEVGAILAAIP